jgi:LL-diaminopimelate aminotransferase
MTGYRTGAIITRNAEILEALGRLRAPMGQGIPLFVQAAANVALADEEHVLEQKRNYAEIRQILLEGLTPHFDLYPCQGTFYLWLKGKHGESSEQLAKKWASLGIYVTKGSVFGSAGEGFIRLSFCQPKQVALEISKRIQSL